MSEENSVVSIFSGCGALDLGFAQEGFSLVYACDIDPAAVDCYARNLDSRVYQRDVRSEEFHEEIEKIGTCDVVLGGFPCQGFSKAGPKLKSDSRNVLYLEMLRVIRALRPAVFIAENVDGIAQNFNGSYLQRITADFEELGFDVDYRILDAVSFGVPQHRRRIFFVGTSQGGPCFEWPQATHYANPRSGEFLLREGTGQLPGYSQVSGALKRPRAIKDAIGDLRKIDPRKSDHLITNSWPKKHETVFKYIGQGQKLCNVRHSPTSVYTWNIGEVFGEVNSRERKILETIAKHRRHKCYGDIPNGNPLPVDEIERLSGLKKVEREIRTLLAKQYLKAVGKGYDLKGAMFCSGLFKRPLWDYPSPTVLTNFHNPRYFLHPVADRPFSLRECARLQGFPDSFKFISEKVDLVSGYRLVGNAVPPPISLAFAQSTAKYLGARQPLVAGK